MTLQEAKQLTQGQIIYPIPSSGMFNNNGRNADNKSLARFRVTSIKTWKRSPERIEIGLKRGLYEFYKIREHELDQFQLEENLDA